MKGKRLARSVSILIVLVIVLPVALVFGSCSNPEPAPTPAPKPAPAPTPTSAAPTGFGVYGMPRTVEGKSGQEFEVGVRVQPLGLGVSGGEINILFRPSVMQLVSMKPGGLLGDNPLEGANDINNKAGTARYALARKGATKVPTPPDVFALLRVRILDTAKTGTYELTLAKVGLADESFKDVPKLPVLWNTKVVIK